MWPAGARNDITDIRGLKVGNAHDAQLASGTSVILFDAPTVASLSILGGAPGTRETNLLDPENLVGGVDALVLSGGSAFGLDAASGVQAYLREQGRGFAVGSVRVPIVPAAILFDLLNGGDKDWGRYPPYRDLGYAAAANASADPVTLGRSGAGYGATTARGRGGLGSASCRLPCGVTVAALVVVNAVGSLTIAASGHYWAAPFEIGDEFGGHGLPHPFPEDAGAPVSKLDARQGANTTIGILVTDARLDKASCKRLAVAGQDGYVRSIWPSHTDFDGDLVFAASTGAIDLPDDPVVRIELMAAASAVMARAVARGVHLANRDRDPH
ncbi:peptidase S58 family protein [Fulvimarina endophytica]|uniref:Peptidase S58 family protein n=1 Tax=Fulvimarina endophytica TaxID=2293836 RepID=A0A371X1I2_9HYPH|nr:P1 family peptidase [Fulvimarina endophytica]RFC63093.1 peptidase S58 family protein [Fulvimarina endophytica]